jgi:hypothetical protein
VSTIQNAGLGEHRIRDLNDDINRLIREKNHWEERIKDLGGPDYRKTGAKLYDSYGVELPGRIVRSLLKEKSILRNGGGVLVKKKAKKAIKYTKLETIVL